MKTMANKPNDKATHKQRESGKTQGSGSVWKKIKKDFDTLWRQQICMAWSRWYKNVSCFLDALASIDLKFSDNQDN